MGELKRYNASVFRITPKYRARVWGGQRLQPGPESVGEAWLVHEDNRLATGPRAGLTLAQAAVSDGASLLGDVPWHRTGARFPLLIKILDCRDWLSVQVHPNDAQAATLEGPGQFGKTEAWHILEAAPGARIIAGVKRGTSRSALAAAIRSGRVMDVAAWRDVNPGDTVFMPAGTLHALGPDLLVYEVQQTSDITYRVWDWDRPASAGRALHIESSVAVTNPEAAATHQTTASGELVACEYFALEAVDVNGHAIERATSGRSFHAVTAVLGEIEIATGPDRFALRPFDTAIVAAADGAYWLAGTGRALVARAD